MPAHESPLVRLERHARNRALEVAVTELRDGTWTSLTWNELYRRVIDGAAGMIEAGVNPGQVVVIRVATGARQLELELATRVAGAVPLLLPEHLDPAEVGRLLDEVEVRLVVVDHESRLSLLRRAALADAQLFECDDRSWERLRGMGLERRKRQPDLLPWVANARAGASSSPVLGLPREKSQAWLFRPECSGALSDLTGTDVVLLTGEATDRFTTVVRDAHLTSGCTLAWVETPDQLEAALAHVRPTHVLLDRGAARVLEDLLEAATVDGSAWHEDAPRRARGHVGPGGRGAAGLAGAQARRRGVRPGSLVGRPAADARDGRPGQPHHQRPRDDARLPHRSRRAPPGHPARAVARARRGRRTRSADRSRRPRRRSRAVGGRATAWTPPSRSPAAAGS